MFDSLMKNLDWLVYDRLQWTGETEQIVYISVCVTLLTAFSTKLFWSWLQKEEFDIHKTRQRTRYPHLRYAPTDQHLWYTHDFLTQPGYCNVCKEYIIKGLRCEVCGFCAHSKCKNKKKKKCKQTVLPKNNTMRHHWLHGNLPLLSVCYVCMKSCGNGAGLVDYRCVWCNRCVHTKCMPGIPREKCNLGRFRKMIVSPERVKLQRGGWTDLNRIQKLDIDSDADTSPLLVFINPKSGGNDGFELLRQFYSWLNPIQIADLSIESPEVLLEAFRGVANARVLICGGDGTAGWILSAISKLKLYPQPPVAILPLGTGNDLARALGWGGGYVNEELSDVFRELELAQHMMLDRWKVTIKDKQYFRSREREYFCNNYLSVGVDADVTLRFHNNREMYPWLFFSRTVNKVWYAIFGGEKVLVTQCRKLHKFLEVEVDGERICIPELEGLVVLNINSYSAGVNPWKVEESSSVSKGLQRFFLRRKIVFDAENTKPSRPDDKQLEVIGIESSFHISQLVVGLSDPMQLRQGSEIKIKLTKNMAMQIDGEPWLQTPCTITVKHHEQSPVLIKRKEMFN
eukprot:CFRG1595T1